METDRDPSTDVLTAFTVRIFVSGEVQVQLEVEGAHRQATLPEVQMASRYIYDQTLRTDMSAGPSAVERMRSRVEEHVNAKQPGSTS